MVLLSNTAVTFQRTNPDGTTQQIPNAQVQLTRKSAAAVPGSFALEYIWQVIWDAPLQFPDGTSVAANDVILWSGFNNGQASLYRPQPVLGILPVNVALLKEEE